MEADRFVIRYECDKCGMPLAPNSDDRFIVKMEIYAAAGHIDLPAERSSDTSVRQIMDQLANADPDEVEDRTYRCLRFDLCDRCRKKVLQRPLG